MTKYTPTVDEVRDRYADGRTGIGEWTRFDESVKRAVEEAYAEFDRMIASVEREAAEKALTEAANELALLGDGGKRGLAGHSKSSASAITHRHAVAVVRARAEAYRQERGEGCD